MSLGVVAVMVTAGSFPRVSGDEPEFVNLAQ